MFLLRNFTHFVHYSFVSYTMPVVTFGIIAAGLMCFSVH